MKKLFLAAFLLSACGGNLPQEVCGNGSTGEGEDCDDGNAAAGDGCDSACQVEDGFSCTGTPSVCATTCGDGIAAGVEECDDGANNSDTAPNACRTDCTNPSCGDAVIDTGEDCDNGANNSDTAPDACRTDCSAAGCGDNVTDTGEECDNGAANSDTAPGACRLACVNAACGDNVVDPGQVCFDPPSSVNLGNANLVLDLNPIGIALVLPGTFTAADLNTDNNLDLIITAPGSNQVVSVLGNGNGNFQAPQVTAIDGNPVGITSGDYDGDGTTDIAVSRVLANFLLGELSILTGDGDGTFTGFANLSSILSPAVTPLGITTLDIEGDGDDDLVSANLNFFVDLGNRSNIDSLRILVNNGAGTFDTANLQPFFFPVDSDPVDIAAGDINNDGRLDIVTANATSDNTSFFLQSNFGGFDAPQTIDQGIGADTLGVELGDFNNDGLLDIASANNLLTTVTVSLQEPNVVFPAPTGTSINNIAAGIRQLVATDLDQDGNLDIVVSVASQASQNDVGVLFGNGDGTFAPVQFVGAGEASFDLVVADFNNDSLDDLAVVNLGNNDISILLANP